MSEPKSTCKSCSHYKPLGTEGSGIMASDGAGEWVYVIGSCENRESVHSGRDNLPEWCSCWLWKHGGKP